MTDNIKILRFLGEELLAEVVDETDTEIEVKNPVRIVVFPNQQDPKNPNVGFAPFCEWTDDKSIRLTETLLICKLTPLDVFLNQYKQQFSGLIVPKTKIIST